MSSLRFFLFDGLRVIHGDCSLEITVTPGVQPLLAYLLLHRHRTHPREKLTDLFWANRDQDRARGCLRTTLCRLRRLLAANGFLAEDYLLVTSTGEISFNPESDHWLDVAVFEEQVNRTLRRPILDATAADAKELEDALQLYTGDLLEGLYDDWVLWERERLQRLYLGGLAYLLHYHKHHQAYNKGIECGHRILLYDSLREEIHREMMQLYLESGQRALAAQQYETCRKHLASELGIQPMEETQALYAQVISEGDWQQPRSANTRRSASIQQALQEIDLGIRKLDDAQRQLRQAIQTMKQFGLF